MPIIGWIISAIVWVFKSRIGLFLAQALAWAGLTYGASKVLVDPAVALLEAKVAAMSGAGGLAATAFNWMGVLRFDVACTMIMSAYTIKLSANAAKVFLRKA